MKRTLLVLIVLTMGKVLWGQGSFKLMPGAHVKVQNKAQVIINSATLKVDGTLQVGQGQGAITFTGSNDTIQGSGSLLLDSLRLRLNSGSSLTLQRDVSVRTNVTFSSGLLNLDNSKLDLDTTGQLLGETEVTRAFTTGTGYLQAAQTLNAPNAANPGNLGAVITSSANLGTTIIKRGHAAQPGIEQGSSINRYFDIIPTNTKNINMKLQLHYFDTELGNIFENNIAMWRSTKTSWTVLGSNTIDTASNFLEKSNIQMVTRMTLANSCPPINASVPDFYIVNPGSAMNTLYIGYGPTSVSLDPNVNGGSSPYSYLWTQGSPTGPTVSTTATLTVSPTTTTTYYLTVTDPFGCSATTISKTINVVDVRCGTKLTNVTICQLQANGSYKTTCVASSNVAGMLSSGSYLGTCQATPPLLVNQKNIEYDNNVAPALTVNAMPNPSTNYFTLVTKSPSEVPISIRVMDILGRVVEQKASVPANSSIQIGSSYKPGVFLVEVLQGREKVVIKLIKH